MFSVRIKFANYLQSSTMHWVLLDIGYFIIIITFVDGLNKLKDEINLYVRHLDSISVWHGSSLK